MSGAKRFTAVVDGATYQIDDIGQVVDFLQSIGEFPQVIVIICNTCKDQWKTGPEVGPAIARLNADIAWEKKHQH